MIFLGSNLVVDSKKKKGFEIWVILISNFGYGFRQ